jgi:hypothetical protein
VEYVVFERERRTESLYYGDDRSGTPRPVTHTLLRQIVTEWPRTTATPAGPAKILMVSRSMVVTSLVTYEQLTLGVLVSLFAVEAALRAALESAGLSSHDKDGRDLSWNGLVQRAASNRIIARRPDGLGRDLWDYGRQLRNKFAHPESQPVLTYAAALPLIEQSHRLVAEVFPESIPST